MPPQSRLGDKSLVPADAHGCPACPHPATGPAVAGSPNVFVNGLPAIRVDDPGIHAACCGPNKWNAKTGSRSVIINGRAAHRLGDLVKHCGGMGQTIEGSPNVIVGDLSGSSGNAKQPAELVEKHIIKVRIEYPNGKPARSEKVILTESNGTQHFATTDENGQLVLEFDEEKELTIEVMEEPASYHGTITI